MAREDVRRRGVAGGVVREGDGLPVVLWLLLLWLLLLLVVGRRGPWGWGEVLLLLLLVGRRRTRRRSEVLLLLVVRGRGARRRSEVVVGVGGGDGAVGWRRARGRAYIVDVAGAGAGAGVVPEGVVGLERIEAAHLVCVLLLGVRERGGEVWESETGLVFTCSPRS